MISRKKKVRTAGEKRIAFIVRLMIVVLLVTCVAVTTTKIMEYNALREEQAAVEAEKKAYEEKIEQLDYQINAPMDRDYIEKYAKDNLDLYNPDEYVYYNDLND